MKTHVLTAFCEYPWAILPQKLTALEEIVLRHANGEKLTAEEVEARVHGASRPQEEQRRGVAVLPLFGTIFPRANLMTQMSGATSAELFGARFSALVDDPQVSAIVLDVNSPGGQVNGVPELSQRIFEARGKKPIVAVANHQMASAAYWIASAADEVVAAPSGSVGSIGVFAVHEDLSAQLAMQGVKLTFVSRGKYKLEGSPYQPLSDEARALIEQSVSETYEEFIGAVARNRGASAEVVRSGFGEGRMVKAKRAVALGMADRIGTLEETVRGLLEAQELNVNLPQAEAPAVDEMVVSDAAPDSSSGQTADGELDREAQELRDYLEFYV